ncbi:MAG: hypothetical protein VST67_01710 [Nitrospirota bacterium]|nr:hypothetical protein [Nitrospirota bacterium]
MVIFSISQVDPEERISRFIFNPRHFNPTTNHITPQAFKPANPKPPDRPERQTSVYRTENCDDSEIWTLGDDYVTNRHPDRLPVLARGDLKAEKVIEEALQIDPDPNPHYRHANIVNWPDEPEQRQMMAVNLAQKGRLVVR